MKKLITYILLLATVFCACEASFSFNSTIVCADTLDTKDENDTKSSIDEIWPAAPNVVSDAAILMDYNTGTILYEKNINEKHYPASTTKILTGIIAIENSNLDDKVTFSHESIFSLESGATHIGLVEGEQISMKDCLYALLLASANEVANGIAEHISGSCDSFATLMNEYAANIGCTNTHFTNPNGLHNEDHYTTCLDMALIAQYAFTNSTFREIDGTKLYTIDKTNLTDEKRSFANHHQMLVGNKEGFTQYKYDDCVGGKTGYTSAADHVLVTYATRGDTTLICVVMNTSITDQYQDSCNLFDYGFDNFTTCNLSSSEGTTGNLDNIELFTRYYNISNFEDSISIDSSSTIIVPNTIEFSDIEKNVEYYSDIKLVEGDNNIGKIVYSYGDYILGSTDITLTCTSETLTPLLTMPDELSSTTTSTNKDENLSFMDVIKKILMIFLCIIVVMLIMLLTGFMIYKIIINKKKNKRKRLSREDYYSRTKRRQKDKYKF